MIIYSPARLRAWAAKRTKGAGHEADANPTQPHPRVPPARAATLRRALLPGEALANWTTDERVAIDGLLRLDPADQQEEAVAIALVLRQALETSGARAALVTPDRDLAGRVATELARYGVVADDSAGEPLAATPPAVFLRLLAVALAEQLAPVPLLAVLKHPLAGAGVSLPACRAAARALELACLRGPRPGPGLTGLRQRVDKALGEGDGARQTDARDDDTRLTRTADGASPGQIPAAQTPGAQTPGAQAPGARAFTHWPDLRAAAALLTRLETCIEPALRSGAAVEAAPADMLAGLIASAERLAATDDTPGPSRLWAGEEGDALATALSAVQAALPVLPDQPRGVLPGLLDAVLEGAVVRTRRALRGGAGAEHPRVFIWGLLEARLQSAEVIVLGGLVEGIWPPQVEPGPWLSRPMRQEIGLPSPEEAVGQSAHDFTQAACAAPTVVLSCPRRRDGAPAVPARWLTRLVVFLKGRGIALPVHPAAEWARQLDQPAGGAHPVKPPEPRPAAVLRPRKLSVTEIETWLRDPYAIHARHILRLKPLDPLDQETDAADYGMLVHAGLHRFLREHGTAWPPNAAARLREALAGALARTAPREALRAWWTPRLDRIADWVAEIEASRRAVAQPMAIVSEALGGWALARPGGAFELIGRADRIERRAAVAIPALTRDNGAASGPGTPGLGTPGLGTPGLGAPGLDTPRLGTPGLASQALGTRGAGHPGLQDRHAPHAIRRGRRPRPATIAGSRDGRGRRVRSRSDRPGGGADLLAPVRRVRAWIEPVAVQGQWGGDRRRGVRGRRIPGPADRRIRRSGAAVSVPPKPRPRAALCRLRATGAGSRMVGGGRGRMNSAPPAATPPEPATPRAPAPSADAAASHAEHHSPKPPGLARHYRERTTQSDKAAC